VQTVPLCQSQLVGATPPIKPRNPSTSRQESTRHSGILAPEMPERSASDPDAISAFPTPTNVARSLGWLRREIPLAPHRVLDCYDLLMLPCLDDGESDLVARANQFPAVLRAAVSLVEDELHQLVLEEVLLSGKQGSTINTRLRSARARAAAAGFTSATTSEKTLGEVETSALAAVARVLLSRSFARGLQPERRPRSQQPNTAGRGYVLISRGVRLAFDRDDPSHQVYTRVHKLRATSNYTRVLSHSYRWSGGGTSPIPQVLSTEHKHSWLGTRQEPAQVAAGWYVSFFHLGRTLRYDEVAEVEWSEDYKDTTGTFGNFLTSRAIDPEMDYQRFELTGLPRGISHRVLGGRFEIVDTRLVLSDPYEEIVPDPDEVYRYEVKRPTKGQHYGLSWSLT
jgi:hypothetical protein